MDVKNNWNRPIRVGREVIAKGAVADIPEHILLQPRIQKLRKAKKLIFPYKDPAKAEAVKKTAIPKAADLNKGKETKTVKQEMPKKDDLTVLVHIGTSREKTLNAYGIFSYEQVVEHAPKLHEILEVTKQQAKEIVEEAKKSIVAMR